jgi:hypothetical protein
MTQQVHVSSIRAVEALKLLEELQQSGLIMDQDFTWRFDPSSACHEDTPKASSARFEFQDSAQATFYQLKWGVK